MFQLNKQPNLFVIILCYYSSSLFLQREHQPSSNPPPFSSGLGTGNGGVKINSEDGVVLFAVCLQLEKN
jgi:hypothetical protein